MEHNKLILKPSIEPKYRNIFRNLIVMMKTTGIPMISYVSKINPIDQFLTSSFLSAMDTFVAELSEIESRMTEINYKGFFVQSIYGNLIKVACFLSEPADQSLKERLVYFTKIFVAVYSFD